MILQEFLMDVAGGFLRLLIYVSGGLCSSAGSPGLLGAEDVIQALCN